MKSIILVMLACAVSAVGCGRKATPLSTGGAVSTNTVAQRITETEVLESLNLLPVTTQGEVIVHEPNVFDPQEQQEQKRVRIQRMILIDGLTTKDRPGQPPPAN